MHVHVGQFPPMRTTVEIRDDQRARLLDLAARRGEKGFSGLVQEALDLYLEAMAAQEDRIRGALDVLGALEEHAADHMERIVADLRGNWR